MTYTSFPAFPSTPSPPSSPLPSAEDRAAPGHAAQEERTRPAPAPATEPSSARTELPSDTTTQQAQQRRASKRESARVIRTAESSKASPPVQQWDMNDTVIRQLEKILGTSLSPKNAKEKEALLQALDKEIEGLSEYLKKIEKYQDRAQQPNEKISLRDGRFCPHTTAMENARQPGLQLEHFDDMQSFIAHLQDSLRNNVSPARNILVRCGDGEASTHHHVAMDIVCQNGMLSIICVEPAPLHAETVREAIKALNAGLEGLGQQPYVWSYLSCNAQTTSHDCVPFGTSYAKKMNDERELMDEMHRKQLAGQPIRTSNSLDKENALLEQTIASETQKLHQVVSDAHKFMPLRFLKHTTSVNSVKARLEERPQDKSIPVNKGKKSGSAQNLLERASAHVPPLGRWMLERSTFRKTTHHYNTSIEEKRHEVASKTRELFMHIRSTLGEKALDR